LSYERTQNFGRSSGCAPEEEKIILMMHYLRSMSAIEIAQKLGVPERSVAAVIATGKARLSKTLGL
jgi:DNA-directed RNA polymerase specialized sigma24 family protein